MRPALPSLKARLPRWVADRLPAGDGIGMAWLLADRVSRIALGLAVNMVLARALGPGAFGQLSYAVTMATMVLPLCSLGLERVVVRELAAGRVPEGVVLGSVGLLRTAGGLAGWLVAVAVAACSASGPEGSHTVLVALVVAGNVFLGSDAIDWIFQARGNFRPCTAARLAAFVVCAIAKLLLARSGAGVTGIAVVVLAEAALSAALLWVVWRRNPAGDAVRWDFSLVRTLVLASSPLLAAEIAGWLFQRLDVLILEAHASTEELGVYAAAQRLAQIGFFIPSLVVQALSPRVARMESPAEALRFVGRAMNWMTLAAYALAAVLTLGAAPFVAVLFGADFVGSVPVVRVLAWSNVFVFLGCMHSLYLINIGKPAISLRLSWLTAVVSVGFNLLLIPAHGAMGAAAANLLTYCCTTVFGLALYRDSRPLLRVDLAALASPLLLLRERLRAGGGKR